jgi:ferredoxin--NADP+ reductase
MSTPGTGERPLCVAVIGSGPSGFYAGEALLTAPNVTVRVDVFDRLPRLVATTKTIAILA